MRDDSGKPGVSNLNDFLEILQGGGNFQFKKIITDFLTCGGLYLTKMKYVKKSKYKLFAQYLHHFFANTGEGRWDLRLFKESTKIHQILKLGASLSSDLLWYSLSCVKLQSLGSKLSTNKRNMPEVLPPEIRRNKS